MKALSAPSFQTYTITQAVLVAGLAWFLTFRVSPIRAAIVLAFIAACAFALSGLTWSWKNKIPCTAAYVLAISAEIALAIPFAKIPALDRLIPSISLNLDEMIMLTATILIFLGCLIAGLAAFIHQQVKDLPQGWRTPLWSGPEHQKVVLLRRVS